MKKVNKIESELYCKANASLNKQTEDEMDEPDKPLGELLDEKEKDRNKGCVCKRGSSCEE